MTAYTPVNEPMSVNSERAGGNTQCKEHKPGTWQRTAERMTVRENDNEGHGTRHTAHGTRHTANGTWCQHTRCVNVDGESSEKKKAPAKPNTCRHTTVRKKI